MIWRGTPVVPTRRLGARVRYGRCRHDAPRCRGVVLLVTLLVLVVLGFAAVALFRASDTATLVSGNLATAQAAVTAADRGVERAIHALWEDATAIPDREQHVPAQNYFACVQGKAGGCVVPGSEIPEIPSPLVSEASFAASGLDSALVPDDAAGNRVRYVIERMCIAPGAAVAGNCNLAEAPANAAGTQHYADAAASGDAFYRVTVMVLGPRDTVVHAQAMLR